MKASDMLAVLDWSGPGIIGAEQFDVTLSANGQGGGAGSRGRPRSDNPSLPVSSRRAQRLARQSVVATDVRIRNLSGGQKAVVETVPGKKAQGREVGESRARRPFGSPPKRYSGAPLT